MHLAFIQTGTLILKGKKLSRLALILLVVASTVVISGCDSVGVLVRNDTGADVHISACVDDTVSVAAGDTFHASGVPQDNELLCLVIHNEQSEICIAISNPEEIHGTYLLSRATKVPLSQCP